SALQFVRVMRLANDVARQVADLGAGPVGIRPSGGLVLLHDAGDLDRLPAQAIKRAISTDTPEGVGYLGVVVAAGQERQQVGLFHVIQEARDIGVRELFLFGSD